MGPTDLANTQFNAAKVTARAAGTSCSVPHGPQLAAAQTQLQAHQDQAPPAAQSAAGGSTTGSLPPDPSKHT